ncbi:uncharacterized protein PFLUO_LOCUS4791 [Penicillium psychrofluorescens]|uniref:uncharacterized protein n=1 Tax=Penicillium psychrofluorescens TaxID=3158075 RepID=UPI003CCD6A81
MGSSIITIQRDIILNNIRHAGGPDWKVLVVDETSRKLINGAVNEEEILNFNISNIEQIEHRRPSNLDMDALYILSPESHIVDCLMADIEVVSLCASLGEYPVIRYYRPRTPTHEAAVLCSHLAKFIQSELDQFAQHQRDFPPPSSRPRGVLMVVDRSMDVYAPLLHEFTYQAMVHDLLPIKDGDKVTYKTVINEGGANEETKDMEIGENDKVWVDYRHVHMKDVVERLGDDFHRFRRAHPQFAEDQNSANVDTIKDMLAGLTEFQEGKNAYTLHLNMADECMKLFQDRKLLEVSSIEQSFATGLDENYKKAKNLAAQLVQLLDDDAVLHLDRLRLLLLYIMYRGGLLGGDIRKLMAHAQLPGQDGDVIANLDLLGVRVEKPLRDEKPPVQPLFNRRAPAPDSEELSLSRYELGLKQLLEEQVQGTLDTTVFPFTRPHTDADGGFAAQEMLSQQASLRSAKPTWARTRTTEQPRQRIIVFMAGGATYAESRACYEVSQNYGRDVFLATTHMLTPGLFMRQVGDLSVDRQRLDIPADRPRPAAPAHLFEREKPAAPTPPPQKKKPVPTSHLNPPAPPEALMANMSINANGSGSTPPPGGKPNKKEKEKKDKEKKYRFFK